MDRTGERWDITQAVSMGFDPDRFEFGIGRNAFYPLDENDVILQKTPITVLFSTTRKSHHRDNSKPPATA